MQAILIALALLAPPGEHFVSPSGKSSHPGTLEKPWDLESALNGTQKVAPGDTIWIGEGSYTGKFEVKLAGTKDAPLHVRAVPGKRVTILDSGLTIVPPADYVWIRDLEIAGSTPVEKRKTKLKGSHPEDLPGTGGLGIHAGKGCKFINLFIHDNVKGGVSWWVKSTDSELYGCVITNNGWDAPDRGHGHCIYAQNKDGIKTVSNCILSVPKWGGSYSMHAYGSSRAYVDNFVIEKNIAFEKGPFLVGGGRPSRNILVRQNYLHGVPMLIGYTAPHNENCEVRDNVVVGGSLTIQRYRKVVDEGNTRKLTGPRAVLLPNKYDPNRAHVAVYSPDRAEVVELMVGDFCTGYRLYRATDFWGPPAQEGSAEEGSIQVRMTGEFGAFILVKN